MDEANLSSDKLEFSPSLRRLHVGQYLTVTLPPRSVGFFVIPGAHFHTCTHEEDIDLIKDEIQKHRAHENSDESTDSPILQQALLQENVPDINDLYKLMEEELHSNENYYKEASKRKEFKEMMMKKAEEQKEMIDNSALKFLTEEEKNAILDKIKQVDKHKHIFYKKPTVTSEASPAMDFNPVDSENIMETNEDIKKLLNKTDVEIKVKEERRKREATKDEIAGKDEDGTDEEPGSLNRYIYINKYRDDFGEGAKEEEDESLKFGEKYIDDGNDYKEEFSRQVEYYIDNYGQVYGVDDFEDVLTSEEAKLFQKMKENKVIFFIMVDITRVVHK